MNPVAAKEHKATNIGQGFPDFVVPDFLQEEVRKAVAIPSANWYVIPLVKPLILSLVKH